MSRVFPLVFAALILSGGLSQEKTVGPVAKLTGQTIGSLPLRNLGPAFTPGRVGDIAVDPRDRKVWYIATASSGLWKTTDSGATWTPIFDDYGSYSLGCITLDPKNPDIVWLGTGENQSQRSVGYGDGLYRSTDGGKTWKHAGLKDSEHIGKILVDPRNSDVVYVAAQGPLWAPGGDRGLYKTTDSGKTWKAVLQIGENTGVTDIALDPRNPDVIYAASYQRRRNVGVLIGGGPEAGIYKSTDGGAKWTKLTKGLPEVDLGRIALAVSPQQSEVVYALVVAAEKESGFFRSADGGASWVKQSNYKVTDPQYYGEIYPDPHKFDRVFAVDVNVHVTEDGGKTVKPAGWRAHSDNHAIEFDPTDPNHLLLGNDGGLYETRDGGKSWKHFTNMPTTQFYRVGIDNALPFYNIFGGAQDNGTNGGPSRTLFADGIRNSDWASYGGADGMQPRVDPEDPKIVYSMSQNGALTRRVKGGGKQASIRPKGGKQVRWNWDTPFIISPHSAKRLYLAGSVLYRSDDRGDNWTAVSPDLTRQIDRAKVPVMGKLWGPGAVTPNLFTTDLGVASALAESPRQEGLLFVGTDDGLVQITQDGGKNWLKLDKFPGVPEQTYVSCVCPSHHDTGTVYAAFNNWQRGDFKPYLLKSADGGKTWTSIAANLPERHVVWSIVEDHVNKDLLFVGTEFGLFFTVDGGKQWVQLREGVPTVAFRDLAIQKRENDLVCATFGRGFFVLDDYSPLRELTPEVLSKPAFLFPPRKAYVYEEKTRDKPAGPSFFAENPPVGVLLTYYLREAHAAGSKMTLTVTNAGGIWVQQIDVPTTPGLHRVSWDKRTAKAPPRAGNYGIMLEIKVGDFVTRLGNPQVFEIVDLPPAKEVDKK
jgi:photosystem II stability/assembly factor-like uncharacterized protein